jgi:hypothetical protein
MPMTLEEEAVLIWPVLAFAARMQRVLTYGELEELTGIPRYAQDKPLHIIFLYCEEKGFPQLNSLAVSQETGFPGKPYPKKMEPIDFLVERARVFTYGWYTKEQHPRSDHFKALQSATA